MVETFNLADFLQRKKDVTGDGRLENLLKADGRELAGGTIDFFADAFVDIADGAECAEWHKITPHLEVFITVKRRKKQNGHI